MPIVAKRAGSNFTPAPEGPQQAVCVDVVDLGLIEQTWGDDTKLKPMLRIVWHSAEIDPQTNKPYVISNRYTVSLDEKANLRKHLEAWRGRAFTDEELEGFDVESVIGANAFIQIVHKVSGKGATFGNIASIMKLPKGIDPLPITPGFIRHVDKEPPAPEHHGDTGIPNDDDIPF